MVSPNPIRNAEFTKTLASVLHRPAIFPMPAFAARLAFGQMADELLLASQRVQPAKLASSGYKFQHPDLRIALASILI
jgi:NAD dependent epimerase/dehydratase family enzyme